MRWPLGRPRSATAVVAASVLLTLPLLSGCTGEAPPGRAQTAADASVPALIREAPPTVREAYDYALAEPEKLSQIPCFCGCEDVGHRNVRDCFVREVRTDGTVVWDPMGAG